MTEVRLRIATKMTLGLTSLGLLMFGFYGFMLVRSETGDLRRAVEAEVRMVGRSLQVSVENALRDGQLADVEETLDEVQRINPGLQITVFDEDSEIITATDLSAEHSAWSEVGSEEMLWFEPESSPVRVFMAMPLLFPGGESAGTLVLERPLTDMIEDLRVTTMGIYLLVLGFVLMTMVSGAVLGNIYITQPLSRFTNAIGRVGRGDLREFEQTATSLELTALVERFNIMVRLLKQTQERLEAEAESRRHVQRGLQKADKLISIGQLSAGLAHEIGSPLQVLHGRAQMLRTKSHDPKEVERIAEIMVIQSERITRIVDQLMHFARRRTTSLRKMDVVPMCTAVIELLQIEAKRRDVTLRAEVEPSPPQIEADGDAVQQIVFNLVTNALNATPRGGEVIFRIFPSLMERSGDLEPSPALTLSVADNGAGITEEDRHQLFDPFFTTRAQSGGVGLGLAIVQGIVDDHRGRIDVESQPGQGATFCIQLPIEQPQSYYMDTADELNETQTFAG